MMLVITNDTKQVNVHTQSKAIKFSQLQMNHKAPKTQKNTIFEGPRPFAETRTPNLLHRNMVRQPDLSPKNDS